MEVPFDLHFSVRYGEIGAHGKTTLSALGNWLQEAAGLSADSLGFGEADLLPYNVTWILTRLVLRIRRLPLAGEKLCVRTWPSLLDRFGHRGYEVYDEAGICIVSGGSAWSVMDIKNHSLSAIPAPLRSRYPDKTRSCDAFICRVIPRLKGEPTASSRLRVRKNDLDINGHVNNTHYLAWILEDLPADNKLDPCLLDITFRTECFPDDELECRSTEIPLTEQLTEELSYCSASRARLHNIVRMSDNSEVCRALTLWEA